MTDWTEAEYLKILSTNGPEIITVQTPTQKNNEEENQVPNFTNWDTAGAVAPIKD